MSRKSRRQVEYSGAMVIETSEHKSQRPRKQSRKGNARVGNGRGPTKVFDKVKPVA